MPPFLRRALVHTSRRGQRAPGPRPGTGGPFSAALGGPLLVYYVSGHGFGHAVRSGLVLHTLRRLVPDLELMVRSDRPGWLFPPEVTRVDLQVDVGVVQRDSLTPLLDETMRRAARFENERATLARTEATALAPLHPALIVSDIPPLAFEVAASLGIPGVAVGNFSWDWIYAHLGSTHQANAESVVTSIAASEARASLLLRLPFYGDMSAFPHVEDVPLIAQRAQGARDDVRARFGIASARPAALLSFGGFELERLDFSALAHLDHLTFVVTSQPDGLLPSNVVVGPRDPELYHDLLAACDVVVMKPGYGTVADCLANRVPMVYATRPGFVEEEVLVPAMTTLGRAVEISQHDLFAAHLAPAIDAALALETPWSPVRLDGAEVVARRLLALSGITPRD